MCASPPYENSISARGPQWGQSISSIFMSLDRIASNLNYRALQIRCMRSVHINEQSRFAALVSDSGGPMLVDQIAGTIAIEREGRVQGMGLVDGDGVGKNPAGSRSRLEPPGSPAAIDVDAADRRLADNRAGVRADVDDAAPLPHHPHAPEDGEKLADRRDRLLRDLRTAALAIADVVIDAGADHQFALVDRKSTRLNSSHV